MSHNWIISIAHHSLHSFHARIFIGCIDSSLRVHLLLPSCSPPPPHKCISLNSSFPLFFIFSCSYCYLHSPIILMSVCFDPFIHHISNCSSFQCPSIHPSFCHWLVLQTTSDDFAVLAIDIDYFIGIFCSSTYAFTCADRLL